MMRYRYTMWDGSQNPFRPSPEDVLDGLTDHLLQEGDLNKALRHLMQRGMMNRQGQIMPGMQDILKQVRQAKEELLQQYNPDSVLSDLQRQLEEIAARERQALDDQLAATQQRAAQTGDDAQQRANEARAIQEMEDIVAERRETLDHLPFQDVGETIRRLQSYDFVDRQAKADFDNLVQSLQQQAMDSLFQMMQQRLQQMTPEDIQRMRQMIEDLNDLLERRAMGDDTEQDFQDFLDRHRDMFPAGTPNSPPNNLDEFLEQMARQMEAMQSLLNSMSEDMRQALQELMQGQFDDAGMQQALSELMQHLQQTMQQHGVGNPFPFQGEESLSLQQALRMIERLQGLEALENTLENVLWGGDPNQLDEQQVQTLMDEATAGQVQALKEMAERLEEQGYIRKSGERMELTSRGVRKIAQRAMLDIFSALRRDQMGRHRMTHRGRAPG